MSRLKRVVLLALLLCANAGLSAQTDDGADRTATPSGEVAAQWNQLQPAQRRMLGRLLQQQDGSNRTEADVRRRWQAMGPARQQALLRGMERWNSLTGEQRQRVNRKLERWRSLPDPERQKIRERFRDYQRLPDSDRARIRDRMREFQRMPPQRRQELRQRWQQLSPEQKRRLQGQVRRMPGEMGGKRPGKADRHPQKCRPAERQR